LQHSFNQSYGRPSGPSTPFTKVIKHEFLPKEDKQAASPAVNKKKLPPVTHTRASLGQRFAAPAPDSREPFKLKRFQKVRGKGVYANDSALTAVATSLS